MANEGAGVDFDLDAFNEEMKQQMKALGVDTAEPSGPNVDAELAALMRSVTQDQDMDAELASLFADEEVPPSNSEAVKVEAPKPPAKVEKPEPKSSASNNVPAPEVEDEHDGDDENDYGSFSFEEVEMLWNPSVMESYEVMEWAISELRKRAEAGDEDAEDDLGGVELRKDILMSSIQSETLTLEVYESKIRARIARDHDLAKWFSSRGQKENAAIVLKRARVAQQELSSQAPQGAAGEEADPTSSTPSVRKQFTRQLSASPSLTREISQVSQQKPVVKEITPEDKVEIKKLAESLNEIVEGYREGAGKWMGIHQAAVTRAAQETKQTRREAVTNFSKECQQRMKAMITLAEEAKALKANILDSDVNTAKQLRASAPAPVTSEVLIGVSEDERQLRLKQYLTTFEEEEQEYKKLALERIKANDKAQGAAHNNMRQQCQFWQNWLKKSLEDPVQPLPVVQNEVHTVLREKVFEDIPKKTVRVEIRLGPDSAQIRSDCILKLDLNLSSEDHPTLGIGEVVAESNKAWICDLDMSSVSDKILERRVARGKLYIEVEQPRSVIWFGMKAPKNLGATRTKIKIDSLLVQAEMEEAVTLCKEGERKGDINIIANVKVRSPLTAKEMIEEHITHPIIYLLPPSLDSVAVRVDALQETLPEAQKEEDELEAPAFVSPFNTRPPQAQQLKDVTSPLLMNSLEALECTWPILEKMGMVKRVAQIKAKIPKVMEAVQEGHVTFDEYVARLKDDLAADQQLVPHLKAQKRQQECVVVLKRIKAMKEALEMSEQEQSPPEPEAA